MRQRDFITLLGDGAAWPRAARTQQAAMPVAGYVQSRGPNDAAHMAAAFGLRVVGGCRCYTRRA
jgi:putative tryptophan/tyrosine transport system substrate-binding protein